LNSAVWRRNNRFTPTWKNRIENEAITEDCIAPSFDCSFGKRSNFFVLLFCMLYIIILYNKLNSSIINTFPLSLCCCIFSSLRLELNYFGCRKRHSSCEHLLKSDLNVFENSFLLTFVKTSVL